MRRKSILKPLSNNGNSKSSSQNTSETIGLRATTSAKQTITTTQTAMLKQEFSFMESCLPKMMSIAEPSENLLLPFLRHFPKVWSFADKVLVLLEPNFRADVRKYYLGVGKSMIKILKKPQVASLDYSLSHDLTGLLEAIKQRNGRAYKSKRV
jgi:hypothetical protein